ncbi:type 2 periplasmic-binding domain-containing protein [Anaerosporobacter faecicola]|uniref:extracellular solute-binding protein n=1 Tax=Anaerosporobacter faecicola TaxID=2718714 RepID=UPI0014392AE3|nr:extracellular solute-binding protein [Anaerosporobacter faecicola]
MKKRMVKVIVISMTMVMALVGCGSNKKSNTKETTTQEATEQTTESPTGEETAESTNPVSDKPVTFSFMYSGEFNADYKSLAKMTELTNVSLDVMAIPDSDYDTRNQLVINTGEDMPDLISKTNPTIAQALSGVLLPISDYFDQMPHYMEFIKKNNLQYLIDDATQSDGKVYELPINTKEVKTASKQIFVRKDVFEENNIAIPTTYDELYDAAKQLKQIYPDVYPIQVIYGNGNLLDMIAPSFGTSAGWGKGFDNFHYVEENDEWIFAPTSEEFKTMLQYLNKLYAEGLLNQEYTTFSSDMYSQNASTDKAFVLMADWLGCETAATTALQEAGNENAEWVPIYPLAGPAGAYLSRVSNSTQTMVVSASAAKKEYFPELIKWLDWMYSEEGINLFSWGIEGETYTVDSNNNKVLGSDILCAANPTGTVDVQKEYGTSNNCFTFVYPYDHELATMAESYKELIEKETEGNAIPNIEPAIALSEDDVEEEALYATNLNDYVDQMISKFIMGGESFDKWDSFISECNSKGAEQLYTLFNEAWKKQNQ